MCVILDLCKTRGRGKKTWNGAPFLIFTGAPKVLSEFAPRGYVILDAPLNMNLVQHSSFIFSRFSERNSCLNLGDASGPVDMVNVSMSLVD